jgi:hypothetical protein
MQVGIIGMAKGPKVYDRQSRDLPINSRVAEAVVDDPLELGAKLKVLRSVRDDPLAAMHSRGQIDTAMFAAGREWQLHHENTQIGSIGAIDTTKEAVDGGRIPEPITDRQIKAIRKLGEADRELGPFGSALTRSVLGTRLSIAEVAIQHKYTTAREHNYLSHRFRECLDTLAKLWGYA